METMLKRKIDMTTAAMKKTTVALPKDLHTQLLHAKVDEERNIQEIVADALRHYFETKERAANPKRP